MNKDKPKFSIISICWNEEVNIQRTCESVCSQNYNDYEWIIIDGGSTDRTLEILEKYSDKITTLVTEPDSGIYNAMNKGISMASGEYIVFLNGGDQFSNRNNLNIVAVAPQMDILYGDLIITRADGTEVIETFPDKLTPNYLLWGWLPHPATFIKMRLFKEFGVYDESFRIAGDYDLFLRLLHKKKTTYYHVKEILAKFFDGGISTNPLNRKRLNEEQHLIRKKYFLSYRFSLKGIRREIRALFLR